MRRRRRRRIRRRRRGVFRDLLCAARGSGPPPPTRDEMEPCGGFLLPDRKSRGQRGEGGGIKIVKGLS